MEISEADFGINLFPRDNRFHTGAYRGPVVPVESLAIPEDRGIDVRHECGPAEPLGYHTLRDVTQSEDIAVFDR